MNDELTEIQRLRDELDSLYMQLARHQHTGSDGTTRMSGAVTMQSSTLMVGSGGGGPPTAEGSYVGTQLNLNASSEVDNEWTREMGVGAFYGNYNASNEEIHGAMSTGRFFGGLPGSDSNASFGLGHKKELDWTQIETIHNVLAGGTTNSFFHGFRCAYSGSGTVSNGGTVFTDTSNKKWGVDELTNAHINIYDQSTDAWESHAVVSNTATQITFTDAFAQTTGTYDYIVYVPVYLGSADYPWRRVYAGDAIRWGYGPTVLGVGGNLWQHDDKTNTTTVNGNVTFTGTVTGAGGVSCPFLPPTAACDIGSIGSNWQDIYCRGIAAQGNVDCEGIVFGDSIRPNDPSTDYVGASGSEWLRAYVANIYFGANQMLNFNNVDSVPKSRSFWPLATGTYDLGASGARWNVGYINQVSANGNTIDLGTTSAYVTINDDLLPSLSNSYNLGSSANVWSGVHANAIYGYSGGNNINLNDSSTQIATNRHYVPSATNLHLGNSNTGWGVWLLERSTTPGVASSYQGFMYYDTTVTDVVFSNGTSWYKVTASLR